MKKTNILLRIIMLAMIFLPSFLIFAAIPKKPAHKKTKPSIKKPYYTQAEIAQALGWITHGTPPPGTSHCLCDGYYKQPAAIANVPHPPAYNTVPVTITAKGPVIFRANGDSVLQQDVVIRQTGRLIRADKAVIHRNGKTDKITFISLSGHVHAQEAGKEIVGSHATFNAVKNILTINHAIYRIAGKHQLVTVSTPFDAWGTARKVQHLPNGVLSLENATYSTCSPADPAWIISAKKMHFDKTNDVGYAKNVVIRFKGVPILWSPYYSFPMSAKRKSGFLSPITGYSTDHGLSIGAPFYWNIAPNQDLLLTPKWYSERGIEFSALYRLMTRRSNSIIYASFIPNDRKFAKFKQNTLNSFNRTAVSTTLAPYIAALRNSSDNRGFIDLQNNVTLNKYFTSKLVLRYVTDPYFPKDFESQYLSDNNNQLPSYAELMYTGTHWNGSLLVQAYQTIHTLDHFTTPAQNQYYRLPELNVSTAYPQLFSHYDFNLSAQAVNFAYKSAYYPQTFQRPIGVRVHIRPSISRPYTWTAGYITPRLSIDSTSYEVKLQSVTANSGRPSLTANRTLPIFDIDSGVYLNRTVTINKKHYIQTLEPRFFYLYTPYLNQDKYPNFDTQELPFSFSDLFSLNRFSGHDRLQNANQLSIGLTSRLLKQSNAKDILTAQLGFITYFTNPHVCLIPGCTIVKKTISPLTGALTFNPTPHWSITSKIAWDTTKEQINNAETGLQFHSDNHHLVVLNYQFTHGNPDTPFDSLGFSKNSSLIKTGLIWPLTMRWNFFGYLYYNLTDSHPEDNYIGLSYHTCCWALRLIMRTSYDGTQQVNGGSIFQDQYSTAYFVEFSLTGLGSAGNQSATNLLSSTMPGFDDSFSQHSRYGYNQVGNTL